MDELKMAASCDHETNEAALAQLRGELMTQNAITLVAALLADVLEGRKGKS